MFEPVWRHVIGAYDSPPAPAIVSGYQRFRVQGGLYPAVIESAADHLPGMLYSGVSDEQLALLDAFEGRDYKRREVTVTLSASVQVRAGIYVFLRPEMLDRQPWDPDAFEREHINDFLASWEQGERRHRG